MFGRFVGTWIDPSGFRATITGNDGTVQVQYSNVNRGPFSGVEVDPGNAPAFITVRFTDVNESIQGTLQDAGHIIWNNGTVWTKQNLSQGVNMDQTRQFDRFFSGEPIILEGTVLKSEQATVSLEMHPGLVVELKPEQVSKLEESTDPVSGRSLLRVTMQADAPISVLFQPKLARLALTHQAVPFSVGGELPPLGGNQLPPGMPNLVRSGATDTIGTFPTSSYNIFWGWVTDDSVYSDWIASSLSAGSGRTGITGEVQGH
jgi:hypothetical protein